MCYPVITMYSLGIFLHASPQPRPFLLEKLSQLPIKRKANSKINNYTIQTQKLLCCLCGYKTMGFFFKTAQIVHHK